MFKLKGTQEKRRTFKITTIDKENKEHDMEVEFIRNDDEWLLKGNDRQSMCLAEIKEINAILKGLNETKNKWPSG